MNRNLEIFTKMYHPYKIERLNNVFVFKTMDGDFAVKVNPKIDYKKLRANALYKADKQSKYRKSHENPVIKMLYDDFLGEPCGHKSHELLHTHYIARDNLCSFI